MNTVEQLHIGLVKAIKKGFLPTYLVKEVYWDNGVAVIQTRHLTIDGLKGTAVRIEALQQFEAKQSLEFIRIYSKYMQVA